MRGAPSFFGTWSRKLSRSLVSISSNFLGSLLETKNFFNNETSLCVLLNVFLFAETPPKSNQPIQTCYSFPSSSAFSEEKFGAAAKKPPNLESHLNANIERLCTAQEGIYAVVDWFYVYMWKQLYAILIGRISFSHM